MTKKDKTPSTSYELNPDLRTVKEKTSYGRIKKTIGGIFMSRNYYKVKIFEDKVFELKEAGKTNREICEILGFPNLESVKNLIKRRNRRTRENSIPKKRGRPRKTPLTSQRELELEVKRLNMENELLRNFLLEVKRG